MPGGIGGMFLKLEGIAGESTDPSHVGEIEIASYVWGVSNVGESGTGGGGGRAAFSDVTFTARTSKASPILMVRCADQKPIKSALFTVRNDAEKPFEYITIRLGTCFVSSYQQTGTGPGEQPAMDSFSLDYGVIGFNYYPQNPDGSPAPPVHGGWDTINNTRA
jgi:type VI secretion system secreted protein Hcp